MHELSHIITTAARVDALLDKLAAAVLFHHHAEDLILAIVKIGEQHFLQITGFLVGRYNCPHQPVS